MGAVAALFFIVSAAESDGWTDDDQFTLVEVVLDDRVDLGDGTTQLTFSADIENLDAGTWTDVDVNFDLPPAVEIGTPLRFGSVAPYSLAQSSNSLVIVVPSGDADDLVFDIQALAADYRIVGVETPTFREEAEVYDEVTAQAFVACSEGPGVDEHICEFDQITDVLDQLGVGTFLIGTASQPDYEYSIDAPPVEAGMSRLLPVRVLAKSGSVPLQLTVERVTEAAEILETGSYVDSVDLQATTSTSDAGDFLLQVAECDPAEETHFVPCYLPSLPIRFNDVEIHSGLTVSGQVVLRGLRPNGRVRIRPNDASSIGFGLEANYAVTVTAEASADVDLTVTETSLFSTSVPIATLNLLVPTHVNLGIEFVVGAEGQLPAGSTHSFHQEGVATMNMEWSIANGLSTQSRFEARPDSATTPELLAISDSSLRTWGGLVVNWELSTDAGNQSRTNGPSYRFDLGSQLGIDATGPDSWTLVNDARHSARMLVDLPGWSVGPLESGVQVTSLTTASGSSTTKGAESDEPISTVVTGELLRWARVLRDPHYDGSTNPAWQKQTLTGSGEMIITGTKRVGNGYVLKLDVHGLPLWELDLDRAGRPVGVVELDDQSLLLAGNVGNETWLMRVSPDGQMQSYDTFAVNPICSLTSIARGEASSADTIVLAGHLTQGTIRESDICLIGFDLDGAPKWARYYESFGDDEANDVIALANGNFAIAGKGQVDSMSAVTDHGGLMGVVDVEGNVLWMKIARSSTGEFFNAVAESADGSLFAVGAVLGCICDDNPSLWVARFGADGDDVDHYLYGQDYAWEDRLGPWVQTTGGLTPYDAAYDLAIVNGDVVVAGKTGLTDTAAWLLRLTPDLAVDWQTTYDGLGAEAFTGVADAHGGLQLLGTSTSHSAPDENSLLLMRVPYDGLMRFSDRASTASRYVQTKVVRSKFLPNFNTNQGPVVDVPSTARNLSIASTVAHSVTLVPFRSGITELGRTNRPEFPIFKDGLEGQ